MEFNGHSLSWHQHLRSWPAYRSRGATPPDVSASLRHGATIKRAPCPARGGDCGTEWAHYQRAGRRRSHPVRRPGLSGSRCRSWTGLAVLPHAQVAQLPPGCRANAPRLDIEQLSPAGAARPAGQKHASPVALACLLLTRTPYWPAGSLGWGSGDRDVHPLVKRQRAQQTVDVRFALGAVQSDRSARAGGHLPLPEPD
jgi:hypothetical protein